MPVNATGRKFVSELIVGEDDYGYEVAVNDAFATIDVGGTLTVDHIGVPMVWVDANSQFEVYVAQVIATVASTTSPLPNGGYVCVTVGDAYGLGFNKTDIDLSVAGQQMTAIYKGKAHLLDSGIEWGAVSAPNQVLFWDELKKQDIYEATAAAISTPTYTS